MQVGDSQLGIHRGLARATTHVHTHVCAHARAHVCAHVYTHVYAHVYTRVCTHVCTHAYTHAYTHVSTYDYMHVRVCHNYMSAWPTACPLCGYGRAGTQNDRLGDAVGAADIEPM